MTDRAPPLPCRWTGSEFKPWNLGLARKYFEPGGTYNLAPYDERSQASHSAYFAELDSKWNTLPHDLESEYPSRESMRHRVLIKTGFCTQRDFVLPTNDAAMQFAAELIEADDEAYSLIEVRGRVVRRYRAMSQSYRAMGRKVFEESKAAVLDYIDRELLGVEPELITRSPDPAPATAPRR
jgi:hypothetical protein